MTAAELMWRMRQRRRVETSTSRADAATPDASSQAMDVGAKYNRWTVTKYKQMRFGVYNPLASGNGAL
jgi:hypothetical protein